MKKIIFLDFDGVMVTDRYQEQLMTSGSPLRDEYGVKFDPICAENLCRIINNTDADIVVTSTWKMEMGLDGIRKMWSDRKLPDKVIDITPDVDILRRGNEIETWLGRQTGSVRYVIIDDCPILNFFREEQLQHLFRVDERTGLDEKTTNRIIEHLK